MALRQLRNPYRVLRRAAVAVAGASVLTLGVVMIALPGPAILVVPAGLAILGIEFEWARRWLRHRPGAKPPAAPSE